MGRVSVPLSLEAVKVEIQEDHPRRGEWGVLETLILIKRDTESPGQGLYASIQMGDGSIVLLPVILRIRGGEVHLGGKSNGEALEG